MRRLRHTFWLVQKSSEAYRFIIEVPELSSGPGKDSLHRNSRTARYNINHQMCAAIQQMGCGPTDVHTLTGFLDLPSSAKDHLHLAVVEKTLGAAQEKIRDKM